MCRGCAIGFRYCCPGGCICRAAGHHNLGDVAIAGNIEIATHFAQTRDELASLEPDDQQAAELARSAKDALDAGRLTEADNLLDKAKQAEFAALR
jgi:hypothetical protein